MNHKLTVINWGVMLFDKVQVGTGQEAPLHHAACSLLRRDSLANRCHARINYPIVVLCAGSPVHALEAARHEDR